MKKARKFYFFHSLWILFLCAPIFAEAQCPEVFDFFGAGSDAPYWYDCSGGDYNFNLQSPDDWGDYTIDWGDGSGIESGATWNSPAVISHLYTAVVDTFVVVITEVNTGCEIEGVIVMEEATSASIQIPVGGLTQACAPQVLEFINSATNVSETTMFTWDFGDGSPQETYDYTNWGQTVSHLYEQGTVDCETEVSLVAENYCNTIQGGPSEATFNPIRIWDLDEAAITASATILCYPDTVVDLLNTTERNCLFQGNIFQRYEYWNFGDYWGLGYDSIVDWTPWPPTFPYTLAYPGIGTYTAMMLDSNYCGIDTAYISIQIVPPPTADISVSTDTVCVGEPVTFFQNSSGGADTYAWNFDDGIGWLPTGSGNITYVYNSPATYNVCSAVSIASSSSGCADTACVAVTVLPSPIADIAFDNLNGCDSLTVDFDDNSTNAIVWDWTFDVDPFTFSGEDPPPIDYNSTGNFVVTLTVESLNGCLDTDQEVVGVFESPVPDMIANNVCQDEEATFIDFSTFDAGDPITNWAWDFGDTNTSTLQNPSNTYTTMGDYDVTLTVSTANCSATEVFPVSVDPAPIPAFIVDDTIGCSPLTVNFTNQSIDADNYTWDFGDGNASADESPSHTFINIGTTDTTYTVVMCAMTTFGCGQCDSLNITVQPGAQASFNDNSVPPSCAPFEAFFENTSQGATSYLWDFGDNTTSIDEHPSHWYENETGFIQVFDVTLIAYSLNGCNDTVQSLVTVYPTPNFDFTVWPDSGCSPLIVTLPFIQGVNEYNWNFGDGTTSNFPTPTHIYENLTNDPIVYDITLVGVSAFGCVDTASSQILITPQPTAQAMVDISSGCSPITVEFENISIQADTYFWNYGDGDTSNVASTFHQHTFTNLTNDVVTYLVEFTAISDDGCDDTMIIPIEVFPEVQASFLDPGPGCDAYEITLENNTLNGDSYDWDLGNGFQSTSEFPSTIYLNDGVADSTYTACVIASSIYGCEDTYCADIIVHPSPVSDFTMSANSGCDPSPIELTNNSELADTFEWFYGDDNSAFVADSIHTYIFESESFNPVEYQVSLVASSSITGCTDTLSMPFTLNPAIVAAFTLDSAGCSPLPVAFGNQSIGASAGFEWDFGDGQGSFQNNPVHTFVNNGFADSSYTVTLIASSIYGCEDTLSQVITVFPSPVANVEIDTTLGCYPLDVVFHNASIGGDSYEWVYGTGQIGDTTAEYHTFTYYNFSDEPVTYDITLIAHSSSGCTSTDQLSVDVLPQLEAEFTAPAAGCSPFEVDFVNESVGALGYQWDFGDGSTHTIANPSHTYYNSGTVDSTYTVELVAQSYYGCFDTTYFDITVYATPLADFEADPESQVFPDATVTLTNNSVAGTVNYNWDMDDGNDISGENPGTYTYESWGVYEIELVLNNGFCQDTAWRTIEIIAPEPIANFALDTSGCAPMTVYFESTSLFAATHFWDFGDGGSSTVANPVYTYYQPGDYTVTLSVTGFGPNQTDEFSIENAVHVRPVAQAAFTVSPNEVFVPSQPVYAINLSQNATNYEWFFGDGSTSTETNPIYYYQEEGYYDVTLVANNEWNCPDTFLVVDAVWAREIGDINFPNAFTPNLGASSGGLYNPQAFDNDIFFPQHRGVEAYQLQIFNKWGELLFESNDVAIGWDGYYKGEICKEDVYAWKAKVGFRTGEELIKAGDVTLLIK